MPSRPRTSYMWLVAVAMTALLTVIAPSRADLTAYGLLCERRVDPAAVDARRPRLSWKIKSDERGQWQIAYRIQVAGSPEVLMRNEPDLWDSGKVASGDSLNVPYGGRELASDQTCYWRVQVWGSRGEPSAWSEPASWEMGLLEPSDWKGVWISDGKGTPSTEAEFYEHDPAPLFRREFNVARSIRKARLHIAGLGYHEATINAVRVGDHVLDPGWTRYDKRVYYSTHDVTTMIRAGRNCIGVTLGNGWYNPLPMRMWGQFNLRNALPVGRPRFIAHLRIDFADGASETVVSDTGWKVGEGPIRFNNIYLGEVYDARCEASEWDLPGFNDQEWRTPALASEPIGVLQAQPLPPIRVTDRFQAVSMHESYPGVFIYDMGQNFSGWASVRLNAAAGTKIVMRYGELLHPDGTLNVMTSVCGQIKGTKKNASGEDESIAGPGAPPIAWQSNTYIAKGGGPETYTPRFTFQGFRYLEITGVENPPAPADVVGLRLNTDVPSAGSFECSNEMFNRIQEMCRRTFLANIFSVQSDCPHRERFGYGGDIVATSDAFMLNFDMSTFYAKAVHDWADSSLANGMFTDTAPFVGIQYCGVGWAMAHPLLLTQLRQYYEEDRLIAEQYDHAQRWLRLVAAANPDGIIKDGLSDHEGLEPAPAESMVTPLYVKSARLLAELARVLDKEQDAVEFERIARASRDAYQGKFFDDATGKAGPGTQASQAFAAALEMVPPHAEAKAIDWMLCDIRDKRDGHLSTGIMGTKFMLDVLSRAGHADTAYSIVNKRTFPGWGWMLENGATTLWEHWAFSDNTFSHSHPMFGSVSQWFFNWLAGIQPAADAVGFDSIIIAPQPVADLRWVRADHETARGRIASRWRRETTRMVYEIQIPVNASALVILHAAEAASVTESGVPIGEARGVAVVRRDEREIACRIGSGRYVFEVGLPQK